ncbi:putative type IIS restriction/modification enzyme [Streptococcus criceti]|uniref:site-specific DNA-methyltransferase (adenine-specific) n=1 Tax=Streptococcus criceti HS-6 TaxID=873449 RepID=G5JSE5_STRCG|nr:TaqI-like C-terminal specificity domain-containing protein [Streptococcus criceti]EHI75341.1 hypothetical protein STRCR_2144 [Streptococcus criceti HS-6]SUN42786.1 putative type IIS restriction/modification enzyme [Streptococcus criceti]
MDERFKVDLFRFAIADDEQFINKTRVLRLNFWKRIKEDTKCRKIINKIFFKEPSYTDESSERYGDVISAVLDTLVLRYILVRILEGRFGYENDLAKKSVAKIGLGTSLSIDQLLESKAHFDQQQKDELFASKKKAAQLSLFDLLPDEIDIQAVSEIQDEQSAYMEEMYGGDLYVSDIAKAATQIEGTLSEAEYALIWNVTSSTDLDFDLDDVTPGTIGEQYEQTLQMKLVQDEAGNWVYSKDNEKQRSQGSFYTSAQITDYIIEQTLGKRLSEIKHKLIDKESSENQKIKILRDTLNLKMADISSGGGTFLAGAVRKLGDWYTELEKVEDIKELLPKISNFKSAIEFQKYAVNHMIYGVDLDLKALIVSSFALTLESLGDTQGKLPELIGRTLIHQNSLVSLVPESLKLEWFAAYKDDIAKLYTEKKKWLSKKSNDFFEVKAKLQQIFADMASEHLRSKKYAKESLENVFVDKHMEVLEFNLPEVFFDKNGNYSGGFDIIFGNPPYIQLQGNFSDIEQGLYSNLGEFESFQKRGDIYGLFFERGVHLLKPNGLLGFITSNKYLRSGYGKTLRNFFLERTNPLLLVNLGSGMFGGATVDTSILVLEKSTNQNKLKAIDLSKRSNNPKERLENMSDYIMQNKASISYVRNESWIILSSIEQSIKSKIESIGTPLKNWEISINYGIKTGFNEAFIINADKRNEILENCQTDDERQRTAELIRPILRGRDIKRYSYMMAKLYVIAAYKGINEIITKKYPAIYSYLSQYENQLRQRGQCEGTPDKPGSKQHHWTELDNNISLEKLDDFSKQKIVYREISNNTDACIVEPNIVTNNKCYIITGKHLIYLLTILNSTIFNKFILSRANSTGGKGPDFMKNISIPIPTDDIEVLLENLYNKRISCGNGDNIEKIDKNTNNIVYSIFELSSTEIEYIETVN